MQETSSGASTAESSFAPTSLTSLIPSFDPTEDAVEVWAQKVELLSKVWPKEKIAELNTRLILSCKGSAFQKLQIHQKDLIQNDVKCVKRLVELVGGQFGRIPLERRYETAEKALFRCTQRSDETNDSYLARTDVVWSELLAQEPPLKVEDLQAYVILRGSLLSSEDKKRVLVDAGAETDGSLTMKRVSAAVRMLGAGFFQDYTGVKKTRLKTYDQQAFVTEEMIPEVDGDALLATEEDGEEDFIEALVQDGDEDAVLVAEYEGAINDTIQGDQELAVTLNAYSDARRRLSERFRNRGFWPVRSKGRGKGMKGKQKSGFGKKSLQDRILSSRCRICNKVGHWKAECPDRHKSTGSGSTSSGLAANITMTEGVTDQPEDALHLEFMNLPEFAVDPPLDEPRKHVSCCLLSVGEALKGISMRGFQKTPIHRGGVITVPRNDEKSSVVSAVPSANSAEIMFASCGSCGVVDLGASKTVIGSNNLRELMQGLSSKVQDQLQRCPCRMQFRFGNQGVLSSTHALVVPIGSLKLKIAVVPGNTPFLLSNAFLRGFQAVIDTNQKTMSSPMLTHKIPLQLSSRGLFLMDLNDVIDAAKPGVSTKPAEVVCHTMSEKSDGKPETQFESVSSSRSCLTEKSDTISCPMNLAMPESSVSNQEVVGSADSQNQSQVTRTNRSAGPSVQDSVDVRCSIRDHSNVQSRSSFDQDPREGGNSSPQHRALHSARARRDEGGVRQDPSWKNVQANVGAGAGLGTLVHSALSKVDQTGASTDAAFCGAQGELSRELEFEGPSLSCRERSHTGTSANCQAQGPECDSQESSYAQESSDAKHGKSDWRGGVPGRRVRDVASHVSDCGERSEGRCSVLAATDVEHGKHATTDCPPHPEQGCSRESVEPVDFKNSEGLWDTLLAAGDIDSIDCLQTETPTGPSSDQRRFNEILKVIMNEFETIKNEIKGVKRSSHHIHLFEVFCSSESRLSQQVESCGGVARRYHKSHTDLMTSEGRKVLFHDLLEFCPDHVWFSPECGPWSSWSNYNQSKSDVSWWDVQHKRWMNLPQLALGVVLLRHQRSVEKHLHWEQPNRSNMFRTPVLQEVFAKTVAAEFDMCNLGDLRDPETGMAIKKGMTVLTTSKGMQNLLHGHRCHKNHVHQPLEGSTIDQGRRVSRTAFSENYPRKFARRVAQSILKTSSVVDKPIEWEKHEAFAVSGSDPKPKRRRVSVVTARSQPVKGHERSNPEEDKPENKRIRITVKGGSASLGEGWRSVINQLTPNLPRVGKQEIDDQSILQEIQKLVPDKRVIQVVGGRGLNRTTAPIRSLARGEAPLRKLVFVHRSTNKIHDHLPWELWEDLSNRKLIKSGYPSKVAITIFAVNPSTERDQSEDVAVPSEPGANQSAEMPEATPPPMSSEGSNLESQTFEPDETYSEKHGPAVMQLSREDRALLVKIHKNAGHPGPDKLAYLLRQQGYRPELVAAVPDLACSACAMLSRPKISIGHQQFTHHVISTISFPWMAILGRINREHLSTFIISWMPAPTSKLQDMHPIVLLKMLWNASLSPGIHGQDVPMNLLLTPLRS